MADPFEGTYRPMLEDETDKDSPDNETTYAQVRVSLETLLKSHFFTGDNGTLTEDPPDDASGVLTDSGASFGTDTHNGRLTIIANGLGEGQIYEIDDGTNTTLIHTGDNLFSDGVRSGNKYWVFYNFLSPGSAHDHDDINSKAVILAVNQVLGSNIASDSIDSRHYIADSIDTEHYAPASVDQAAVGPSAIGQGELKTGTNSASRDTTGTTNTTLSGGQYNFIAQDAISTPGASDRAGIFHGTATGSASEWAPSASDFSYRTNITIHLTDIGGSATVAFRNTYVNSSDLYHWIFVLMEKGVLGCIWQADSHPKFGNMGIIEHPFNSCNIEALENGDNEIIVINPSLAQVERIAARTLPALDGGWLTREKIALGMDIDYDRPERDFTHAFLDLYEIQESKEAEWISEPITIDLPKIHDGKYVNDWRFMPRQVFNPKTLLMEPLKIAPVKRVLLKPDYITPLQIKEKV